MNFFRKKEKGFTLIELILVVILLGMLIGLAINSTAVLHHYSLRGATEELLSYLRKAQHLAIINACVYNLEFKEDSNYRIMNENQIINENQLKTGITLEHNFTNNQVIFYSLGTASQGTITLINQKQQKMKIVISTVGRIRVER